MDPPIREKETSILCELENAGRVLQWPFSVGYPSNCMLRLRGIPNTYIPFINVVASEIEESQFEGTALRNPGMATSQRGA